MWLSRNPLHFTSSASYITEKIIEDAVYSAYIEASQILTGCNVPILDPLGEMISFDEVNQLAFKKLSNSRLKMSHIQSFEASNDDKADRANHFYSQFSDNEQVDHDDSLSDIEEFDVFIMSNVSTSTLCDMRIFDSIPPGKHQSFFRVEINGQQKYLHRQTATWCLSKDKMKLCLLIG